MGLAVGGPAIDDRVHHDGPDIVAFPILTLVILHFIPKLIKLVKGLVGLGVEGADAARGRVGARD